MPTPATSKITEILGDEAAGLLQHQCKTIPKANLHLPGPDSVERLFAASDRSPRVMTALQSLMDHGRLGGTGYVSILPVDQGIRSEEHTSELQSLRHLVCRLLLEKKKKNN